MQKTDAELIAEVEKRAWFLEQMAKIPADSPEDKEAALLLGILPELARRLKAANERNARACDSLGYLGQAAVNGITFSGEALQSILSDIKDDKNHPPPGLAMISVRQPTDREKEHALRLEKKARALAGEGSD